MVAQMMTPKQQRFVAEYLVDLNATQAAIRAGYSARTASSQGERLLRNVEVAAALGKAQAKRAKDLVRTAADVLKDIQDVTKEAREAGDHRAAFKGLELEGKHIGMFAERIEHGGAVDVNVSVSPAIDGFLKKMAAK